MHILNKRAASIAVKLTAVLLLFAAANTTFAQTARSGDGDARLQAAIAQLTTEKTQLQAEIAALKKDSEELAKLRKTNSTLDTELKNAQSKAGRSSASSAALTSSLDVARSRLDELVEKYRELATQFRDSEVKLARSEAELSQRNQQFKACATANDELSGIALDALSRYENKGCFERMAQAEPFTGIKRARIENLVDEYQYQVEKLRVVPDPASGQSAEAIAP
jgi:chromosome segregation ATPase